MSRLPKLLRVSKTAKGQSCEDCSMELDLEPLSRWSYAPDRTTPQASTFIGFSCRLPYFATSHKMPIHCPIHFKSLSKDEFSKLDFEVMSHAFACHTTFGRLADEQIYRGDFASRLSQAGFQTEVEVPVTASFRTFAKSCSIDQVGQRACRLRTQSRSTIGRASCRAVDDTGIGRLSNCGYMQVSPEI